MNKKYKIVSSSVTWVGTNKESLLAHPSMVLYLQSQTFCKISPVFIHALSIYRGALVCSSFSGRRPFYPILCHLMPFIPSLSKFLYLFLSRKLYLTKSWLGTFSAIIHSGPTKHHFGPVVRDDRGHIGLCWARTQKMCKCSQEQGSVFFLGLVKDDHH